MNAEETYRENLPPSCPLAAATPIPKGGIRVFRFHAKDLFEDSDLDSLGKIKPAKQPAQINNCIRFGTSVFLTRKDAACYVEKLDRFDYITELHLHQGCGKILPTKSGIPSAASKHYTWWIAEGCRYDIVQTLPVSSL